jgi:hypothetical protein
VIKQIAHCPYCAEGEIGVDCEAMEIVLNPDSARQQPCRHLVCLQGIHCRGATLRDGTRQAGFSQLCWKHPRFAEVPAEDLRQSAQKAVMPAEDQEAVPAQPPFLVQGVHLEMLTQLSPEETVRWFDQVGWEQAGEEELPYEEHQVAGWVVFARDSADLAPLLPGAEPSPTR